MPFISATIISAGEAPCSVPLHSPSRYRKRFLHWTEESKEHTEFSTLSAPRPLGVGSAGGGGRERGGGWREGLEAPPVFDLDFGRVAMLTCFDVNFPELWMHLSARSVDVVFWPSMYSAGRFPLAFLCVIWFHLISLGFTWLHLVSF